jgi:hypothetical protein
VSKAFCLSSSRMCHHILTDCVRLLLRQVSKTKWYIVFIGLQIKYSSGNIVQLGSDTFPIGETHEFEMKDNERIVRATIRAGWMVDQLTFYSNRECQYGPYGGPGGGEHRLEPSNKSGAYLAGICCRVDHIDDLSSIRHLRLVWACFSS